MPVVFRMFQPELGTHLYTSSSIEAQGARAHGYVEEGVPFSNEGGHPDLAVIHRFHSASTSDYVLTADADEIARLSQADSGFPYDRAAFSGVTDRTSVVQVKEVSGGVDSGGRRSINKKIQSCKATN